MPTDGAPMVLDMATSAIAYFELVDRARRGVPAPPDVGFNSAGCETTDAAAILDGGAIRPFDRHDALRLMRVHSVAAVQLGRGCWKNCHTPS